MKITVENSLHRALFSFEAGFVPRSGDTIDSPDGKRVYMVLHVKWATCKVVTRTPTLDRVILTCVQT